MKISILIILSLLLSGCLYVNDRGISTNYYNECHEYYDAMGIYHKECDKNMVEFKDVKNRVKSIETKIENKIDSLTN